MAWPTGNVSLTNVDADSDSITSARADIYTAFTKLNEIITNGPGTGNVTVYNDDNVAAYLPNHTGNLKANVITTLGGIFWSNGTAYSTGGGSGGGYGNTQVSQYLASLDFNTYIGAGNNGRTQIFIGDPSNGSYWQWSVGSGGLVTIGTNRGSATFTDESVTLGSTTDNTGTGNVIVSANPNQTNYFIVNRPSIFVDTTQLGPYSESVYAIGNSGSGTITPNVSLGPVQTITATGNFTLAAPTNMQTGSSITFIIRQDATGSRTCSFNSSYKFSGGSKTLSTTADAIDVVTVFYDGTTYLCNLIKDYS